MAEVRDINRVIEEAASAALGGALSRVLSKATTDSEGFEALLVTVVLKTGMDKGVTGDAALDALVRIRDDLSQAGEERLPIVEYATEEELESSVDPEA